MLSLVVYQHGWKSCEKLKHELIRYRVQILPTNVEIEMVFPKNVIIVSFEVNICNFE